MICELFANYSRFKSRFFWRISSRIIRECSPHANFYTNYLNNYYPLDGLHATYRCLSMRTTHRSPWMSIRALTCIKIQPPNIANISFWQIIRNVRWPNFDTSQGSNGHPRQPMSSPHCEALIGCMESI